MSGSTWWPARLHAAFRSGGHASSPSRSAPTFSTYIRYEYEITDGLNIAAGEQVRWLPRRGASDLALPGNDFWVFNERLVALNHFGGEGEWLDIELSTDPAILKLCSTAFEAVWKRATPHADYRPA